MAVWRFGPLLVGRILSRIMGLRVSWGFGVTKAALFLNFSTPCLNPHLFPCPFPSSWNSGWIRWEGMRDTKERAMFVMTRGGMLPSKFSAQFKQP